MPWQYQTETRKWKACSAWLAVELVKAHKPGDNWNPVRWVWKTKRKKRKGKQ